MRTRKLQAHAWHFAQGIWARADVKSDRVQHALSAAGRTQPHCPQQLAQVLEVPVPPRADLSTNTFAANQPAGMASQLRSLKLRRMHVTLHIGFGHLLMHFQGDVYTAFCSRPC
jgi:hypothetical protein